MANTKSYILQARDLSYSYKDGALISFPDFEVIEKDRLLITGNSGTGKTTLLHLISGLLMIQNGEISIAQHSLSKLSQINLDKFRGQNIGLVFQQPKFIGALTVVENITIAQYFGNGKVDSKKASQLLEQLGIKTKAHKQTRYLSGGERQRLAIARALSAKPKILLADEPTSSLDDMNAELVYNILVDESKENGATLIVVSHDQRLKVHFENRVNL